jgi:hypothetical protein
VQLLLEDDATDAVAELCQVFPVVLTLTPARQIALANLAYNIGIPSIDNSWSAPDCRDIGADRRWSAPERSAKLKACQLCTLSFELSSGATRIPREQLIGAQP